ncbi:hypothetical protein M0R45_014684 [Rubus argutus]|uniref:Uncharacterized protein n=1 Tax=Rubus argutus TaxID=59490 RepID=A0AAW1XPN3_RUBAR
MDTSGGTVQLEQSSNKDRTPITIEEANATAELHCHRKTRGWLRYRTHREVHLYAFPKLLSSTRRWWSNQFRMDERDRSPPIRYQWGRVVLPPVKLEGFGLDKDVIDGAKGVWSFKQESQKRDSV